MSRTLVGFAISMVKAAGSLNTFDQICLAPIICRCFEDFIARPENENQHSMHPLLGESASKALQCFTYGSAWHSCLQLASRLQHI